jgi:hypothetical protein
MNQMQALLNGPNRKSLKDSTEDKVETDTFEINERYLEALHALGLKNGGITMAHVKQLEVLVETICDDLDAKLPATKPIKK